MFAGPPEKSKRDAHRNRMLNSSMASSDLSECTDLDGSVSDCQSILKYDDSPTPNLSDGSGSPKSCNEDRLKIVSDLLMDYDSEVVQSESNLKEAPVMIFDEEEDTTWNMMKSRQFMLIYLMNFLSFFLTTYTVNTFKVYGLDHGMTDSYLSVVGSVGAGANSLLFIWSGALDKYSYKLVYGILLAVQFVFGMFIVTFKSDKYLFAFCYCMILFCGGGHSTLVPNIMKQIFGKKATVLYGFAFSFTGMISVVMILVQIWFLKEGSFYIFFLTGSAMSALSFIILIFFFKEEKYSGYRRDRVRSRAESYMTP